MFVNTGAAQTTILPDETTGYPSLEVTSTTSVPFAFRCSMFATEDGNEETQQVCCAAGRAWQQAEAQGGCSVQNDATTDLCSEASKLCTECAGPAPAGVTWQMAATVRTENGTSKVVYEMVCTGTGHGACGLEGLSYGLVFMVGIAVLVAFLVAVCVIDRIAQPAMMRCLERRHTPPRKEVRKDGDKVTMCEGLAELAACPAPPDLQGPFSDMPPLPPGEPGELPPSEVQPSDLPLDTGGGGFLRCAADARIHSFGGKSVGSIYFDGMGRQLQHGAGRPCSQSGDSSRVQFVACAGGLRTPTSKTSQLSVDASEGNGVLAQSDCATDVGSVSITQHTMSNISQQLRDTCTTGSTMPSASMRPWPDIHTKRKVSKVPVVARLWASRICFLVVACAAMVSRNSHIICCAILLDDQRAAFATTAEVLACTLPFLWCAWRLQLLLDVQQSLDHRRRGRLVSCLLCERLPACTTFAVLTVCLEVYSVVTAGLLVADAACASRTSASVLYCAGVAVTVMRGYAAVLAFKLQRRFAKAQRRVIPLPASSGGAPDFDSCTEASAVPVPALCTGTPTGRHGTEDALWLDAEIVEGIPAARQSSSGSDASKPSHISMSGSVRPFTPEWRQNFLQCSCLGWGISLRPLTCTRLQKRTWTSLLWDVIRCGLLLTAAASVLTVWFVKANDEERASTGRLASSCITAQNSTSTCSEFEYVGHWDHDVGDLFVSTLDTMEDCCAGCDGSNECQAWLFEDSAKRCRWIRFIEEPCSENPGDNGCRCTAHPGTSFGFKPTSDYVWLRKED